MRRPAGWCLLAGLYLLSVGTASARTLEVGPDRELKTASAAARVVADGDRVVIDPGEYFDCAIWQANDITIEAAAPKGAGTARPVFTDRACAGKAAFVIGGNDVTLRGLVFTRIRVPDGNGAGIRAEGRNLTVEHCEFTNNQAAILTVDQPDGFLIVRDSSFAANGACQADRCVGTLNTGQLARLRVERSRFADPRASLPGEKSPTAAEQIRTGARSAELVDNRIEDGDGASSGLVAFNSTGSLLMSGNSLEMGPKLEYPHGVIFAGTGWGQAESLVLRGNSLVNHSARPGLLLLNWTNASPVLDGNKIAAGDTEVSSRGLWWHRVRYGLVSGKNAVVSVKDTIRHIGGSVLSGVKSLVRG